MQVLRDFVGHGSFACTCWFEKPNSVWWISKDKNTSTTHTHTRFHHEMQGWAWVNLENKVVSNDGDLSHIILFILQIEENISILL